MRRLWNWVTGIVLTLFMISLAVIITFNCRPLYVFCMQKLELSESVGMSENKILEQYDALIAYNQPWGEKKLEFPDLPSSETGEVHFEEVKEIYVFFFYLLFITVLLLILLLSLRKKYIDRKSLLITGCISIGIPILIGTAVAFFWDRFFILFHEIMFPNDYWIFSEKTDPIISLLPDTYFMYCAIMIVGIVLLGGILCFAGFLVLRRRTLK